MAEHGEDWMEGVVEKVADFLTSKGYNDEEDDEWDIYDDVLCAIKEGCGSCYISIRDDLIEEKARDLLRDFVEACDRWETDDHERELDFMLRTYMCVCGAVPKVVCDEGGYCIICPSCGLRGVGMDSKDGAIGIWNEGLDIARKVADDIKRWQS